MNDFEYHVASYVVHAVPGQCESVSVQLTEISGIEVHAQHEGKLVVTAEAGGIGRLAQLAELMQSITGVAAVAPVYHEFTDK